MVNTIAFDDYLRMLMPEDKAKELLRALDSKEDINTILIKGPALPTGKSTLAKVLESRGYHVIEGYQVYEVTLDKILNNMIPGIENRVK